MKAKDAKANEKGEKRKRLERKMMQAPWNAKRQTLDFENKRLQNLIIALTVSMLHREHSSI